MRDAPRGDAAGTKIGAALFAAMESLARAPCTPNDEVIDLVTNGEAHPETTQQARVYAEAPGVRIAAS